jgi:hypothetical protein
VIKSTRELDPKLSGQNNERQETGADILMERAFP